MVIHDERLDRTSSGKGWVKDYTLEELRQFDYSRGTEFGKERQYTIPLTVGKLLGKEEQTEDEKKPLSEMNDQMRQRLFELFRSKYEVQEAENKNAEPDTGYIFTT